MITTRQWLLLLSLLLTGCTKNDVPKGTPDCITDRITQLESLSVSNPPAKIWQYTYNRQTVYYIPPKCCDIPSVLLNENCNTICSPDGGITGGGDGKCPDFFKTRTNEKLIWADPRK